MTSAYPGALDPLKTDVNGATDTLASVPHDALHNNQAAAIKAVQAALGVNPQGTYATVADRLAASGLVGYQVGKSARYAVSGGPSEPNSSVGNIVFRAATILPVTTTRWRMHFRNYELTTSTADPTPGLVFPGIYIGQESLDSTGAGTGNFTATPLQAAASTPGPADGTTEFVFPWVTDPGLQFTAFTRHLLSFGVIASTGFVWARSTVVVPYHVGSADTMVGMQTVAIAGTSPIYGDWWIEYEYDGDAPVGLHVGDSLTDGLSNGQGQTGSHVNIYARRERVAASALAVSGLTLQMLAGWGPSHPFWAKYGLGGGWVPDYAVIALGTNDINAGATLTAMQGYYATIVSQLRGFGITRIYGALVPPRALAAGPEAVRASFNTWLSGLPLGLLGAFDYDRAVADPIAPTQLLATYNSGDATHLRTSGQAKLAQAIAGRLGH